MRSTELFQNAGAFSGIGSPPLFAQNEGAAEAIIIGVLFVVILAALITVFVIASKRAKKGNDD